MLSAVSVGLGTPAWGQDQGEPEGSSDPIIVYGYRDDGAFEATEVEDELGEEDIAAYGANNVGELLGDISGDVDPSEEGPVVLINGQLANGIDDITTLPTEAVSRIQLLPRDVAARYGQSPSRRVVNVVIKRDFRQTRINTEAGFATAGEGGEFAGEVGLTRIVSGNRSSITLRAEAVDPLLESDRGIITDTDAGTFYDFLGNVVPADGFSEIDPQLSALVGAPVDVAGVPVGISRPTLADFAATGNRPNRSDIGDYRTLVARSRSYSVNASLSRRLDQRTNLSVNVRGELEESGARVGAASALVTLPAASPFNPFSRDVALARYLGDPLEQDRHGELLNVGATLNSSLGDWRVTLSGSFQHRETHTETERSQEISELQEGLNSGLVNPFANLPPELLGWILQDSARTNSDTGKVQAIANGALAMLPAGPLTATFRIGAVTDRFEGISVVSGAERRRDYGRDEANAQASVELPLVATGPDGSGVLGLTASGSTREVSKVGTLFDYSYGINWRPVPQLALTGAMTYEEDPPSARVLSDAVIVTDNVRVFDFLRNVTVPVTRISGGNPDLPTQHRRTLRLAADAKPFGQLDLNLIAEYTLTRTRDTQAGLPPVSAAIQAAFPDRYQRDETGLLVFVDSRPVAFARDDQEQLRWGFRLRQRLGGGPRERERTVAEFDAGDSGDPSTEGAGSSLREGAGRWRLNASAFHVWALRSTRLARAGLAEIDLLRGGAFGYGGGRARHTLIFDLALAGHGVGFNASGSWRSAMEIRAAATPQPTDLRFASHGTFDLRAFADLGTILPDEGLAKGARLTVAVDNVFDTQQRVQDRTAATPLGYQPYLIEPLGRVIRIELRKIF